MAKLEICCFGIECAQIAQEFGADRIELCSGAAEGGLTPSYGCLKHARKNIHIPVHPIVRPRGGDFCYNTMEFEVIKDDVQMIRELGFPGVVVGMLDSEGRIDLPRMELLMRETRGLEVTFHRFRYVRESVISIRTIKIIRHRQNIDFWTAAKCRTRFTAIKAVE